MFMQDLGGLLAHRSRRTRSIASHVSSPGRNLRCFGLASRHPAVVAGAVVAGLRRRVRPPSIIDIVELFALARTVPTNQPTKRKRKERDFLRCNNLFFLLFS